MSIQQKLRAALDKLGKTNGTAPEEIKTRVNRERELHVRTHEFYVSKQLEKYAKARVEDAKKAIEEFVGDDINDVAVGTKQGMDWSPCFSVIVQCKNPAKRINKELLRSKLMLKFNMSGTDVDTFIETVMTEDRAARSIEVSEIV